ncbi:hypothetical protein [Raoultibacter timonensis]|uniref:Tail protein n=1 Tax=Raoultibacter timonensis TaxID=1907662 RepID=A0ABN6MJB3_9ACTN|nr:hypothetical protein [Raoultibacter timonensis]BDE96628.1 tail protein [Raoultibacter timonensis]BDF51231.1 tail protein [Raoultibacter timonensis]
MATITNNAENVSVGKPKAGGAVFAAPIGTAVPSDASTALDQAFKCLGYVSEDGVTNTVETEGEDIKAWGGDVVATPRTSRSEKLVMTFIEQRQEVFEQVYGEGNVTVSESGSISIAGNGNERAEYVYVVETLLTGGKVMRTIALRGKVVEVGDVVFVDGEPIGYETTIQCLPDVSGNTSYRHIAALAE